MEVLFEKEFELSEINNIAAKILSYIHQYEVLALSGNLGAGKTTLTAAIVQLMGIKDKVSSPTFSIINIYQEKQFNIHHSDWYRINDEDEAIAAGIEDMMQQPGLKIIEWWEKAPGLLPRNTLFISLSLTEGNSRRITISKK
ncbi:MAG TPA: tRNA (adenosine(37)-N6)-threonylcarbamoyltransferase complex ATPase subunit type 1 TsaE [Edaphocola sp.]|nr:tRNA (adenosine(37)-N6)-threonylcarbamoyltransferase complex ATPase subunit type 1 TsaE [Edaphocola sp.]